MKIPKTHFNRFKREFVRWQERLGLTCYRVCFEQKNMPRSYAQLAVDEKGQIAVVGLCSEVNDENQIDIEAYEGPEAHAKHEAIHLLSHRLVWLAQERYTTEDEISREWEALVRRLEKIL